MNRNALTCELQKVNAQIQELEQKVKTDEQSNNVKSTSSNSNEQKVSANTYEDLFDYFYGDDE